MMKRILNITKKTYNQENLTEKFKTVWLDNLILKFEYMCNTLSGDYIIYLEDDVKINKLITTDLQYDLNGFCPNKFGSHKQTELFKTLSVKYHRLDLNNMRYSGHGGSIYKRDFLKKTITNKELITDMRENFYKYHLDNNLTMIEGLQDYFISFILFLNGGTIGPLNGHGDDYAYNDNSTLTVQHQYKKYYNAEQSYPQMLEQIQHLYVNNIK